CVQPSTSVSTPRCNSGATYFSTSARVSSPSSAPASTCSTSPGQACTCTATPPPTRASSCANFSLASVPLVASTATRRERVCCAAGFTAGSMPTIGTENCARSVASAAPEAVLQATTTALARCFSRNVVIASD